VGFEAQAGIAALSRLTSPNLRVEAPTLRITRLALYLLLLADDFSIETESGILIDLKLSHQALAELIGSSRSTVTHLLQSLRQE
jgi:CRP-like cAMP-binding protein